MRNVASLTAADTRPLFRGLSRGCSRGLRVIRAGYWRLGHVGGYMMIVSLKCQCSLASMLLAYSAPDFSALDFDQVQFSRTNLFP